jgi:hypothetical protein
MQRAFPPMHHPFVAMHSPVLTTPRQSRGRAVPFLALRYPFLGTPHAFLGTRRASVEPLYAFARPPSAKVEPLQPLAERRQEFGLSMTSRSRPRLVSRTKSIRLASTSLPLEVLRVAHAYL